MGWAPIATNIDRVLLGKREQVQIVVAALLAGGHVLIEDAPGVGKTLLAKAVARSIGGTVGRVQGTADLLPADVAGVTILTRSGATGTSARARSSITCCSSTRSTGRRRGGVGAPRGDGRGSHHSRRLAARPARPFLVLRPETRSATLGAFPLIAGEYDRYTGVGLSRPSRPRRRRTELLRGNGGLRRTRRTRHGGSLPQD